MSKIISISNPISTQFSSIWPEDRTLSGVTTPGQSVPGSDAIKGYPTLPIAPALQETHHQIFLVSYPEHSLVVPHPSPEKHSVYSTAPADKTIFYKNGFDIKSLMHVKETKTNKNDSNTPDLYLPVRYVRRIHRPYLFRRVRHF